MTNSTSTNKQHIIIHTDGACIGNPGPGGWAAHLQSLDGTEVLRRKQLSGGEADTTNNRMEMLAAINALRYVKKKEKPVTVISDSQVLVKGMNEWIDGWKQRGWKKADRKPVQNADLWMLLDELNQERSIAWEWVKGHAGDPFNELVDRLATKAAQRASLTI